MKGSWVALSPPDQHRGLTSGAPFPQLKSMTRMGGGLQGYRCPQTPDCPEGHVLRAPLLSPDPVIFVDEVLPSCPRAWPHSHFKPR